MTSKSALRTEMRFARAHLTSEELRAASDAIRARVEELQVWRHARTVHTYVGSLPGEVLTDGIIAAALTSGRTVIVPCADMSRRSVRHVRLARMADLRPTTWGGREPVLGESAALADADLVIVPGLAFDRMGNRLGMGGGFYDAILHESCAPKVGLAHAWQVVDAVPVEPHDARVDMIVTPGEVIVVRERDASGSSPE